MQSFKWKHWQEFHLTRLALVEGVVRGALEKIEAARHLTLDTKNDVHLPEKRKGGVCVSYLSGREEESEYDALSSEESRGEFAVSVSDV